MNGSRLRRGAAGTIVYVVGARPNLVKMAPVVSALRTRLPSVRHVVVSTGQHYDDALWTSVLHDLGMSEPDHALGVGSGTHGVQTARALERLEAAFALERPDLVLVPGDVNSTLAAALAAAKLGIRIGHVEAGLRSFDRTMPEEVNRIVTDRLTDDLYVHSLDAVENLVREGVDDSSVHFVGNTMIDSLVRLEPSFRSRDRAGSLGLAEGGYLLVTLHRPALVDGPLLEPTLRQLARIARELPVVFPVHPRTRLRLTGHEVPVGVTLVDPLGYVEFLSLEATAAAVLTDSGGVQEETTYLGVPCFTLRANTERPVTLHAGTNTLLGLDPSAISRIPERLSAARPGRVVPPLWDGRAAERLADHVAGLGIPLAWAA